MVFFFLKKIKIFEIQNFKKIPSFIISFYFFFKFLAFCFLFHLSKLVQKLCNFLQFFIGRVRDFTNDFWKILKVLLEKIQICKIFFFSIFSGLLFGFFTFFIIFDILFSISSICNCEKILDIFMFFYFMDQKFYQKNFGKSWNIFLKNIDI